MPSHSRRLLGDNFKVCLTTTRRGCWAAILVGLPNRGGTLSAAILRPVDFLSKRNPIPRLSLRSLSRPSAFPISEPPIGFIEVTASCRTGCRGAAGFVFCSRSKYPSIIVDEADEPNALVDFLDAEFLAGHDGGDVDPLRSRPPQRSDQGLRAERSIDDEKGRQLRRLTSRGLASLRSGYPPRSQQSGRPRVAVPVRWPRRRPCTRYIGESYQCGRSGR